MTSTIDIWQEIQGGLDNITDAWNVAQEWDPGSQGGVINPGGPNPNWTGSGLGSAAGLAYPPNLLGTNKMPIGIQFVAHRYSPKTTERFQVGDPMADSNLAVITLPLPRDIVNSSSASYKSATLSRGSVWDMNPGDLAEQVINGTGGLGAIAALNENYYGGMKNIIFNNIWLGWLKESLKVTEFAGEYPQDLRDNVFAGMQFRTHNFSWTMVPKNSSEARLVAEICAAFSTLSHPTRNAGGAQFVSKVLHPPMWSMACFDSGNTSRGHRNRWVLYPQLCALANVSFRNRMSENGPWVISDNGGDGGWPAATQLTVSFLELEPNINTGGARAKIQSRSGALMSHDMDGGFFDTQGDM